MVTVPLTGGAYQARSVIASAQRSLNLYAEPLPSAQGEPAQMAHYPTPGLTLLGTLPQANVRGIRQCTTGGIYAVAGSGVYHVDPGSWTGTHLGDITTMLYTPVSMADNGTTLVIVDGTSGGWTVDLTSNAFAAISDSAFYGATRVDYLDTYFLLNKPNTPQFYSSDSNATTFDPLWFANKESFSDLLVTLAVAKREIWLLGQRTTEVFYNVGAADFPFQEMPGVFIDQGCDAPYSVATYDNTIYWLGNNRAGHGIVLSGAGYSATRISTFAIEEEIKQYAQGGPVSDAIGMVYSLGGHIFYVLTFPRADATWVYDIATKEWHEWKWIDSNGVEHRHRANCMYNCNGIVVAGDWNNGNLYRVDASNYTDNGQPIKRVRSYPHLLSEGKRIFYRQFLADIETGTAPEMITGRETRLDATFTAADGTSLSAYTSDVGGGWTAAPGDDTGVIQFGQFVGTGGIALYQSAATLMVADYSVRFSVVPSGYDTVPTGTLQATGRATGAGTGYQVSVTADGSSYTLTLAVLPSGTSASVAMGTLSSGIYTVWLVMRGSTISAQAQRSQDGLWLRSDATWQTDPGTTAAQFTDSTYAGPGAILIGGDW